MTGDLDLTDYERTILENVEEFGCHITSVFDGDHSGAALFTYSVGFPRTVQQGEVITFGLPMEVSQFMINQTLRQCYEGLTLRDGVRISGLLEGFDVIARSIPAENIVRDFFNSAMWYHRGEFGTALESAFQLVWPSAVDGIFPWEEGCADTVIELQPALYETGIVH